jgi:hypothetical protein
MIWVFALLLFIGITCELYAFRNKIFGGKKVDDFNITKKYLERREKKDMDYKDQIKKEKQKAKKMWTGIILVTTILIVLNMTVWYVDASGASFEFQNKVHSHMENAYYANSPELMKTQLQECVQGMRELKLTPDMYGAFMPWDRIPSKQMQYQYQHIDSIIQRVDYVIEWRDSMYNNTTGIQPEQLGDVYNQKMDNLRSFIKAEGWSDWIAHDAYYTNHYMWLYLISQISLMLFISIAIWFIYLAYSVLRYKEIMFD